VVLKRLAGPFRHYFNARFSAIHQSVVQGNTDDHTMLAATLNGVNGVTSRVDDLARTTEAVAREILATTGRVDEDLHQTLGMIGRSLDDLGHKIDMAVGENAPGLAASGTAAAINDRLDHLARRMGLLTFDPERQGSLAELGEYEASVANFAHAHDSWAAQAGLWFNPPLLVNHAAGGVSLIHVNERIAELPFVFRQLAGLSDGARVLDVGSTESTVALSLASLGYDVTAVDPRPYPLSHPLLTTFQGPIENFTDDRRFDAVVLLSSIEHFGVGAYGLDCEDDADMKAMEQIWQLCRPGARLVFTAPYGDTPATNLQRTYGPGRLSELLKGWEIDQRSYLSRDSMTVWSWRPELEDLRGEHVVLVSATRTEGRA
jgi:SAM-dependent methyltransferase